MTQEKRTPGKGKANKLLGENDFSRDLAQGASGDSAESSTDIPFTEKEFNDEWTIPFDRKISGPLARFATTKLLSGRKNVSQTDYEMNLSNFNLFGMKYQPLNIQTKDGASISALEIGDPESEKCLIVFQPKDGNFKELGALKNLFEMAVATGVRVIAFNYRDNPASLDSFDYDGCAVTQYAMQNTPANQITFYGESLGGAIAAETAAKLEHDENKQVKILCSRAPNSLAEAGKNIDVTQLMSENTNPEVQKQLNQLKTVQKLPLAGIKVGVKVLYGRDFNTEASLKKLDAKNIVRLRVHGDNMVTEKTTASRTVLGYTKQKDKHNAGLSTIEIYPDPPSAQNAKQTSQKGMTGKDLLVELVNRDNTLQEKPSGK